MKQVKAIQGFNFKDRDVVVEDTLFLVENEADELIKTGQVKEIPIEMPAPPPPPAE